MSGGLTRRSLLAGASAAAVAGIAATLLLRRSPAGALPARALDLAAPAAALGRRYLAASPAEADAAVLRRLVEERLGGDAVDHLVALVRGEYAAGDVVTVDGWVLSRSEARVYALASLSEP